MKTFNGPLPAILYKRCSTDHQDMQRQDHRLPLYCGEHNLIVEHVLSEQAESSGKAIANRKEGKRLRAILAGYKAAGRKFAFVAMELDRVGCDMLDTVGTIREIWDSGGTIHFTEEGGMMDRDKNEMLINIKAAVGQERLSQIQKKTRSKAQQLVASGKLAGHIPFGFDAVYQFSDGHEERVTTVALRFGNAQKGIEPDATAEELMDLHGRVVDKRLEANTAEQEWVRWMAQRRAEGWSYCAIAQGLKGRGVNAKMGKAMSFGSVESVLNNGYSQKILATPETLSA